jgi:hypothetical protein
MATALPLDRITSLALDPGASVVVRGLVTTSVDGSSFDAAMQWDGLSPGASRPGGLFDLEAGGLRVAEQHPEKHEYVLASTGGAGPACAAGGVASPCLVPRLASLAHERLRTQAELASTLHGGLELEGVLAPPVPAPAHAIVSMLTIVALVAAVATTAAALLAWLRRRSFSALGRIRSAAREALKSTHGDATLDRVRREVHAMVARARVLDDARRVGARRLARIDRVALDRRRAACARSADPDAAEALTWITAEQAEAERLAGDVSSSVLGLQRIESALRVITLRVREHRGTRARIARHDPVDAAAAELQLRDEARDEVDRAMRA